MISGRFLKSSFIYVVAGMLPMASSFLLVPLYMENLSTRLFGELAIYNVFASLVQVLVTYSFDSSLYIHFHDFKRDAHKLSVFISSAFLFMLGISVVTGLILFLLGDLIFSFAFPGSAIAFYPFGLASIGIGVFQSLFKVYSSLMQTRERPVSFFWSNLVTFALIAVLTYAGLKVYPESLMGPVMGKMLAVTASGLWALMMVFREFGFHFDFKWLKTSFGYNNYSFIYQVEQWLIANFDRVIMAMLGLELAFVGVYDFVIKCLVMIELLMNSMHSSFYPKLLGIIADQPVKGTTPEVNRYYHGLMAVIMLSVCVCIFGLPIGINLFSSKQGYQDSIQYIPFIAGLYFLRAIRLYFTLPYGTLKYSKPLPVIYAVVTLVKIGVMVLIARRLGVYGVVIASFVAAVVEILLLRYGVRDKFIFKFNTLKIIGLPLLLLSVIVGTTLIFGERFNLTLHFSYLLICVGLLSWAYRNELKALDVTRIFKKKTSSS